MKNTFNLFRIRGLLLLKNAVWVIPVVLTTAFLGIMYNIAPAYICSSFLLSSFICYVICILLSMGLQEKENDVFEEILLFHSTSECGYYLSRELLFFCVCLLFSLVLTIAPVLRAVTWPSYFTRAMEGYDIVCGAALIFLSGLSGMETGDLFHPRIFGKRRNGIIGAVFVSILMVCKSGLIRSFPFLKFLDLLLPPVMDGFEMVGNTDRFDPAGTVLICIHLLLYSLLLAAVKILLLSRKKYRS